MGISANQLVVSTCGIPDGICAHYNATEGAQYAASTFGKALLWRRELKQRGIKTILNIPRGADIAAACGQLANRIRA